MTKAISNSKSSGTYCKNGSNGGDDDDDDDLGFLLLCSFAFLYSTS